MTEQHLPRHISLKFVLEYVISHPTNSTRTAKCPTTYQSTHSSLQRKIITRCDPFRPIGLPYSPPFTRDVRTDLQYLALRKTNLVGVLHIGFVGVYGSCTMGVRSRFFDDTLDSIGRVGGVGIAFDERGGSRWAAIVRLTYGDRGGGALDAGIHRVLGGRHLWSRYGWTRTGDRIGIHPCMRCCGGCRAKVE